VIRIHTFGGLSIRGDDGKALTGAAAQPRRLAILALLARAGERGLSRDRLLSMLWPDADDERGPRALAQAIYALRKELGAEDIISGAKELRLDPMIATTDVAEFASAISRGDDARAAALYDGPFLEGFHLPGADEFSRWAERERSTLAHDYMRALEALARSSSSQGRAQEALTWWR
jgi:DNA-binding SARP family transcriptional activator